MTDTDPRDLPPQLIAHTPDGPVHFAQPAPSLPNRAARRRSRRGRVAIVSSLTAFGAATLLIVGGASYASGLAAATAASTQTGTSSTVVELPSTQLPGSGYPSPYGRGTGSSSGASTGTPTSAVAASAAQTAGVVTIVSDLGYQGAQSAGTGIVLTSDGMILTNNHVIEGSTSIRVTDELTGESYSATVVGTDKTHDIAVLQLDGASGLTTAALDTSGTLAAGDAVTAVGNAQGTGDLVAAAGTVAALEQTITTQSEYGISGETLDGLIRIDADIVSGDSGGPLLDADGEVVGIDTAASSGTADITGFAIPIEDALDIVAQIEAGADTATVEIGYPGFLGIGVADAGASAGAGVASVIEGAPAATAGLAAGDVITAVNGTAVASAEELTAVLGGMEPGETVSLAVTTASGTSGTVDVTLIAGPAA
ncbi:S1C family serine protease [Herbiconiux sp. VKM Ac-2851]|uniref:S1C family serine protease n=1 Tax=Herbiconiux sp. VKM Ac-2851 TaxID=2739025 RepID=UPI00156607AB|nr:trypsin-like peptidase domain-containing protein [Herbiconiux sp. VKM Ac-2851]NQX34902.1 trypsin-like peptidase domain-containing protein [Herbiconiux sp. VKM Ac-2851]